MGRIRPEGARVSKGPRPPDAHLGRVSVAAPARETDPARSHRWRLEQPWLSRHRKRDGHATVDLRFHEQQWKLSVSRTVSPGEWSGADLRSSRGNFSDDLLQQNLAG